MEKKMRKIKQTNTNDEAKEMQNCYKCACTVYTFAYILK